MRLQFISLMLALAVGKFNIGLSQGQELSGEEFCFFNDNELDSGDVQLLYGINFKIGTGDLLDSNQVCILALVDYLQRNPNVIIELGQHMDCRDSNYSCTKISVIRAKSIHNRLIELGVSPDRVIPIGFGESTPLVDAYRKLSCDYIISQPIEKQEELHALNRRVEVKVISKEYVP